MKNKYDIRINPPQPDSEEIAQQQDFDHLLERYHQWEVERKVSPSRSRRLWWSTAAAAALLLAWLTYSLWLAQPAYEVREKAYFAAMEYVHPPLTNVQIPFTSYSIDNEEETQYIAPSGTRLNIPARAFQTAEGEAVKGKVNIRFREMTDYVDFFLAGIPMMYDSAGIEYHLASAGMIEVYAEQDGHRLELRHDKAISVELPAKIQTHSLISPPEYNLYKLNPEKRRWEYRGKGELEIKKSQLQMFDKDHPLYTEQEKLKKQIAALQSFREEDIQQLERSYPLPAKPLKPVQPDENQLVFDLNFRLPGQDQPAFAKHPELQKLQEAYGQVLWQLSPGQTAAEEQLNQHWQNAELEKVNERDYLLSLFREDNRLELLITPVVPQSDYAKAMERYRQRLQTYETARKERDARLAQQKSELLDKYSKEEQKLVEKLETQIQQLAQNQPESLANNTIQTTPVVNRFHIDELGIWNCDRPIRPQMVAFKANFILPDGSPLENTTLYLADKSRNTLQRFLATKNTRLEIDLLSDNLLWALTPDGQIAKLPKEELIRLKDAVQNQPKQQLPGQFTFVLQPVELTIRSKEDVALSLES